MEISMEKRRYGILSLPVIVGSLGYFVDIYDLLVFVIIRKPSLQALGLNPQQVVAQGENILGWQMIGLLAGGILWGVLGDKHGRLRVLFGSILLYSIANFATGFVTNVTQYTILRVVGGIGLAGELGAGITLVAELLPKEKRGISTTLVASLGLFGAAFAFFVSQRFGWRQCYYVGGGLGLLLLLLRVSVLESEMFKSTAGKKGVSRGNFIAFFTNWVRFRKYMMTILIGLPTWFIVGILIAFCDQFGAKMGIAGVISPGKAIMYAYIATAFGGVAIGLLSQVLKSRKKALVIFYLLTTLSIALFFLQGLGWGSVASMYCICGAMGFAQGFWSIFVTIGAEQFGTNLRATAATTIPNMVRGSLWLIIALFRLLRTETGSYLSGGWIAAVIVMAVGFMAIYFTEETFHKDLDYLETP